MDLIELNEMLSKIKFPRVEGPVHEQIAWRRWSCYQQVVGAAGFAHAKTDKMNEKKPICSGARLRSTLLMAATMQVSIRASPIPTGLSREV